MEIEIYSAFHIRDARSLRLNTHDLSKVVFADCNLESILERL